MSILITLPIFQDRLREIEGGILRSNGWPGQCFNCTLCPSGVKYLFLGGIDFHKRLVAQWKNTRLLYQRSQVRVSAALKYIFQIFGIHFFKFYFPKKQSNKSIYFFLSYFNKFLLICSLVKYYQLLMVGLYQLTNIMQTSLDCLHMTIPMTGLMTGFRRENMTSKPCNAHIRDTILHLYKLCYKSYLKERLLFRNL